MAKKKAEKEVAVEETLDNVVVVETTTEEQTKSIEEMTALELKAYYDEEAKKYAEEVAKIQDPEKLNEMEKELMEEWNETDKVVRSKKYEIADSVVFNTRKSFRNEIGFMIRNFLERIEVDYPKTLGLWELYQLWSRTPQQLTYGEYESTLRTLSTLKFKGNKDWENILTISEYFKQCNEEYIKDSSKYDFIALRHQAIMQQRELSAGHTEEADALEGISPESVNA